MSTHVRHDAASLLDAPVRQGEQALFTIPSTGSGLDMLPDEAFQNLLIVSPWSPHRVEETIRERGAPLGGCGMISLGGSPHGYDGPLWTTPRVDPSDLTGLSIRFSRAMRYVESGAGWVLVDNLQLLLMYAERRRVFQLLDRLRSQVRQNHVTGTYAVADEAITAETHATLQALFDRTVGTE